MMKSVMRTGCLAAFVVCSAALAQVPDHVDWRAAGAVTPVRDQGQCGSDYAFATIAAVEGAHQIASHQLVALSEQQIVDCGGAHGCNGGSAGDAMQWIAQHGSVSQSSYPYTARTGVCKTTAKPVAHIAAVRRLALDVETLRAAVARHPIAAVIDASSPAFSAYKGGVYDCRFSRTGTLWVTIVGYSSSADPNPYWIVKNSFGTSWGEGGYMRLARYGCKTIFEAVEPVP